MFNIIGGRWSHMALALCAFRDSDGGDLSGDGAALGK